MAMRLGSPSSSRGFGHRGDVGGGSGGGGGGGGRSWKRGMRRGGGAPSAVASKYEDDEEECFQRVKELWHGRVSRLICV